MGCLNMMDPPFFGFAVSTQKSSRLTDVFVKHMTKASTHQAPLHTLQRFSWASLLGSPPNLFSDRLNMKQSQNIVLWCTPVLGEVQIIQFPLVFHVSVCCCQGWRTTSLCNICIRTIHLQMHRRLHIYIYVYTSHVGKTRTYTHVSIVSSINDLSHLKPI